MNLVKTRAGKKSDTENNTPITPKMFTANLEDSSEKMEFRYFPKRKGVRYKLRYSNLIPTAHG